jgi:hypothetical protein
MVGIPVSVGDIISKGAEIVTTTADVADNFISGTKKDILKNPNKFDSNNSFNQMSELIKTKKKIVPVK